PYIVSGQRWFSLRVTEQADGENHPIAMGATASTISKVTALSVVQSPQQSRTTSSKVRFRGRGFTDRTKPVYAHSLCHNRVEQTGLIGKPYGDCGLFSVRRRQFPMSQPRTGTWQVQFDQSPVYSDQSSPYTRIKINVARKPRRD